MFIALPKNVWLLMFAFAIFMSLTATIIFIGGIIGKELAPSPQLSTLPIALLVVGTAISIVWVVKLMSNIGRKKTFIAVSFFSFVICWFTVLALVLQSFWLFCLATFLFGTSVACMNQFRFAAIESVTKPCYANATSTVLLGGISAAFLGPEIALMGKDMLAIDFAGSFMLLSGLFIISIIIFVLFSPVVLQKTSSSKPTRPMLRIMCQPVFIVAITSAVIAYAIMSYVMTAMPISMYTLHGHSLTQVKFVMQSHILAMFVPSLLTAWIVGKIGLENMMLIGAVMFVACLAVAYIDQSVLHYWWSLVFLGIGWNFLFVGATSMLPATYKENEKYKVQLFNDFTIFSIQAVVSLSAGWFVFKFGWQAMILSVVPVLVIQLILSLWNNHRLKNIVNSS